MHRQTARGVRQTPELKMLPKLAVRWPSGIWAARAVRAGSRLRTKEACLALHALAANPSRMLVRRVPSSTSFCGLQGV